MEFDPDVIVSFVTDRRHNMSLVHGDTRGVLDNRRAQFLGAGIHFEDLVCARQVHGSGIQLVGKEHKGRGAFSHEDAFPDTDALITSEADVPLAVFTADCLSIFLYDPVTGSVGIVHAGWRSTRETIVKKTLLRMTQEFGSREETVLVRMGPCIRECCYEVKDEVCVSFPRTVLARGGKNYFDLALENRLQLLESGVLSRHISSPGECTSCRNDVYYSFRKEGALCGRMMSVIMLRKNA